MPHGERFGGWVNGAYNAIAVTADIWPYPNDGRDEFVVMSGWGLGVIGWQESASFEDEAMAADGSTFSHWGDGGGQWTHNTGCNTVHHAGPFSSPAQYGVSTFRGEIFITCSDTGLGILSVYSNEFRTRNYEPWLTVISGPYGQWRIHDYDEFEGFGDFNGDGQTDILVKSGWGFGLLSRTGSSGDLETIDIRPHSSSFGTWYLGADNEVLAVGDFNGNGRDEFIIRDDYWGIGVIGIKDGESRLSSYYKTSFGTPVSSRWTLRSTDTYVGSGRLKWGPGEAYDKDSVLLRGIDGLAVLTFNTSNLSPYIDADQHFAPTEVINGISGWGFWRYHTSDNISAKSIGDLDGDGFANFRVSSDWGSSVVGRTSSSDELKVHAVYREDCSGTYDYDACHGKLGGSWLMSSDDFTVTETMTTAAGHERLLMRRFP
jgi:hypothetical protein